MMDEKMKAAFDAWLEKESPVVGPEDIVEWTLDYLRSQQQPFKVYCDNCAGFSGHIWRDVDLVCSECSYIACSKEHPIPSAPAVPDGWKLVPIHPTEEMLDALDGSPWVIEGSVSENTFIRKEHSDQRYVMDGWIAMLATAPQPKENSHD